MEGGSGPFLAKHGHRLDLPGNGVDCLAYSVNLRRAAG
jgi:hypothetical protein